MVVSKRGTDSISRKPGAGCARRLWHSRERWDEGLGSSLSTAAAASPAQAAGDPDNGARLTQTWCSGCHAAGASGADVAPPLREIASRPGRTQAYLYAWLTDPHPPMPRLDLSNRQIADLMAYLTTLAKQP